MNRFRKGDIITCFSLDNLKVIEDGLINDGYGFIETYDTVSMRWKIKIIKVREAADEDNDM